MSNRSSRPGTGFTLLELLIAMSLVALVSGIVLGFLIPSLRAQAKGALRVDLQEQGLVAMMLIVSDVQQGLPAGIGICKADADSHSPEIISIHRLIDVTSEDPPARVFERQTVVYAWMPGQGEIRRRLWPESGEDPVPGPTVSQPFRPDPGVLRQLGRLIGPHDTRLGRDVTRLSIDSAVKPPSVGPPITVSICLERAAPQGPPAQFQIQRTVALRNAE